MRAKVDFAHAYGQRGNHVIRYVAFGIELQGQRNVRRRFRACGVQMNWKLSSFPPSSSGPSLPETRRRSCDCVLVQENALLAHIQPAFVSVCPLCTETSSGSTIDVLIWCITAWPLVGMI